MTGNLRRSLAWAGLGALIGVLLFAFRPSVHALPEYATRTGEPCATCHVNPAGGGPRTVRGALWIAAGKPEKVPPLPGAEQSAAGGAPDGQALYSRFGCSGCHGAAGEGGAGPALNRPNLQAGPIGQAIRNGQGTMMAFRAETMPDAELAAVVRYVQTLSSSAAKAPVKSEAPAMGSARVQCSNVPGAEPGAGSCRGN